MTITELNDRFAITDIVRFEEGAGGLSRMTVQARGGAAEIYLHGAHVTAFTPDDGDPVLWVSEASEFQNGKPIRGGVPVCFPWFGAHPSDPAMPSHGFVRLREWNVDSVSQLDAGAVEIRLSFEPDSRERELFPNPFRLTHIVTVSDTLSMKLEAVNTGSRPLMFTEALHSYFSISDIRIVEATGLDKTRYIDRLLETDLPLVQKGAIRFTAETDRPYIDTEAACVIEDVQKGRSIRIEKRGSQTTVVWNPWIAKSRRMPDFGNDEWTSMLCIETANAVKNAITLAPGASHTMEATISSFAL